MRVQIRGGRRREGRVRQRCVDGRESFPIAVIVNTGGRGRVLRIRTQLVPPPPPTLEADWATMPR